MKSRLLTLIAAAAIVAALPGLASAASMKAHAGSPRGPIVSEQTIEAGPVVPPGDDDTMDAVNAEHAYLHEVCPTVLSSPGRYDGGLVGFCQEDRG